MIREERSWLADLSLGIIAFIWGITFTVVKNALADIHPFAFLFLRFMFAALIVLPLIIMTGRIRTLPWKAGLLAGFFLFVGYASQTIGLQYTTASKSGFITGLNVVLVPIFAATLERKRMRWNALLAVVLAVLGLYFLTNPQAQSYNRGDTWTLICAVGFALHIVTLDYFTRRVDYFGFFFLQILVVGILSGLLFPFQNHGFALFTHGLTMNIVGALLLTGVFATALAFFIQNWAQRVTTATRTALLFTLEPVFAALTGYLVLAETLGMMGMIGGVLILAGIVIAELRSNSAVSTP